MSNKTIKPTKASIDLQRVAFIIPYFGSVPWYFNLFVRSCSCNADIDFILITDMDLVQELPDNITVVKSTLGEVSKLFTGKLGFEINLVSPYKLCDLRPAYGLVFSSLLEGYDYWGYCDIDLVFGNIRALITEDILNSHEVITIKKDYIAGFFSLFRNNDKINNLFKESKDYQKAFQLPLYYDFDECNWEWEALHKGVDVSALNSEIDSITHVIKVAEQKGEIAVYWNNMENHPGKIVWDRGELIHNNKGKVLLCHFIFFKDLDFKYVPGWKTIPDRFYINSFYISGHAPGSPSGRLLHLVLSAARSIKRSFNILSQYAQWATSYVFASRKTALKDMQDPAGMTGNYRHQKWIVGISLTDGCLHLCIDGRAIPLLNKGAGKFVLAKCNFMQLTNVKVHFLFNKHNSTYAMQVTGSGITRYTFFKIPDPALSL